MAINALQGYIERLETLLEERASLNEDMAAIYQEAKDAGFVPKLMREIIRERAMEEDAREERANMLDLYRQQLGMLSDTPLGEAALRSAAEAPAPGRRGKRGKAAAKGTEETPEPGGVVDETPLSGGRRKKDKPEATGTGFSHGAGAEAGAKGRPRSDNPHPVGTMSHAEWDAGWLSTSTKPPAPAEPALATA